MRTAASAALLAFAFWPAPGVRCEEAKPVELFPIVQEGKWGYMDKAGKVVVQPKFDWAWDFSDGLARVQVGLLRGYVDPTGKVAIEPKFFLAWDFREGLAAVMVPTGWFGDTVSQGKWGFIDKTGTLVVPATASGAEDFHEGWGCMYEGPGGRQHWGFVNKEGKTGLNWFQPQSRFSEGLALVRTYGKKKGAVDAQMKFVFELDFEDAGWFSDGLAPVSQQAEVTAADKAGKEVKKKVRRWGYIDKAGKFVIEPKYDDARPFSEGLASVSAGGRWGCIDKAGSEVIKAEFDFVAPFSEGLARVVVAGKHGFIDRAGKAAIEPKFDVAWEFSRGLARVLIDGKKGYIDRSGQYVWAPSR